MNAYTTAIVCKRCQELSRIIRNTEETDPISLAMAVVELSSHIASANNHLVCFYIWQYGEEVGSKIILSSERMN